MTVSLAGAAFQARRPDMVAFRSKRKCGGPNPLRKMAAPALSRDSELTSNLCGIRRFSVLPLVPSFVRGFRFTRLVECATRTRRMWRMGQNASTPSSQTLCAAGIGHFSGFGRADGIDRLLQPQLESPIFPRRTPGCLHRDRRPRSLLRDPHRRN